MYVLNKLSLKVDSYLHIAGVMVRPNGFMEACFTLSSIQCLALVFQLYTIDHYVYEYSPLSLVYSGMIKFNDLFSL